MTRSRRLLGFFGAAALLTLAHACDYVGGRAVTVDFASADGVHSGMPVYFAGVQVGKTGDPDVVAGRAVVQVRLARRFVDALPPGAVFVVQAGFGRPEDARLVGYDLAGRVPRAANGAYPGFSSELEMAVLVGTATAQELWRQLESAQ